MRFNNIKIQALFLCGIAALISTVGFLSPEVSTGLAIVFAVLLIVWANPIGLPALAVLWIQAVDFFPGAVKSGVEIPGAIFLAGFPLTLPLASLCCITGTVLWKWLVRSPSLMRHRWLKYSFLLWLTLFVITVISAFMGKNMGNSNWTQPLRISMALSGLFYGIMMTNKIHKHMWVLRWLLGIAGFVLFLMILHLYWSHIGFYYVAVGSCSLWFKIKERKWMLSLLCATPFLFIFLSGDTLTVLALTLAGFLVGYLLQRAKKGFSRKVFAIGTLLIMPLGLVMVVAVLVLPMDLPVGMISADADLRTRFLFKLYQDRGPLWEAAWKLATDQFSLITPSGSSLILDNSFVHSGKGAWNVHVHNTFLEVLRQTGFLGTAVFIVLFLLFWFGLRKALLSPLPTEVSILGGASLVAAAVGAITGVFPFDFSAGPWVWMSAGVTVGFSHAIVHQNRRQRPIKSNIVPAPVVADNGITVTLAT